MTDRVAMLLTYALLALITIALVLMPEPYRDTALYLLAASFALFVVSWFLSYFAFHRFEPRFRAALTVATAYVALVVVFGMIFRGGSSLLSLVVAFIPGALFAFAYHHRAFRRLWVDAEAAASDDVELMTPDAERAEGLTLLLGCLSFAVLLAVLSLAGGLGRMVAASLR